jgi:uncharacterized protein (DUF362 family)
MKRGKGATESQLTRREFFGRVGASVIGLMGLSALAGSCARSAESGMMAAAAGAGKVARTRKPIVVVARDSAVWNGRKLDRSRVRDLVFRAVRKLAGAESDETAWQTFFDPGDSVGIKLNTISGRLLSSTPEVADAIIDGILLAGVPGEKIAAWDRLEWEMRAAGFKPGRNKKGALFTATDSPSAGYEDDISEWGEVGSRVSRLASRFSSAIVNVPVLKDHDLCGITGCLKNYYGAINNPNKLHDNACDPYVADLNMLPAFREKTRLIVMDATTAQYHAGPGYKPKFAWQFSGVIVGADPVALDTVALKIIDDKRKTEGMPSLEKEGRAPAYLKTAADDKHRLGENRLNKIKIIEV